MDKKEPILFKTLEKWITRRVHDWGGDDKKERVEKINWEALKRKSFIEESIKQTESPIVFAHNYL